MAFTVKIETDNAAFSEEDGHEELARIIEQTARDIQVEDLTDAASFSFSVVDSNGNAVGHAELLLS